MTCSSRSLQFDVSATGPNLGCGFTIISPSEHVFAWLQICRYFEDVRNSDHGAHTLYWRTFVHVRCISRLSAVVTAAAITACCLRTRCASARRRGVISHCTRVRCCKIVIGARLTNWAQLCRRDWDSCPNRPVGCGAFADVHRLYPHEPTVSEQQTCLLWNHVKMVPLETSFAQWFGGWTQPVSISTPVVVPHLPGYLCFAPDLPLDSTR